MVDVADPDGVHAHDAYHRFLREGKWDIAQLWCRVAPLLVSHLGGNLVLVLDLDDTLFHKAGRKVNGAGSFRDPIRSRGQRTVFAHGLNLAVLTTSRPRPAGPVSAAGRARRAPASVPLWSSPPRPSRAGPWPTSTSAASRLSALSGHGRSCGTPSAPSSRSCSWSSPTLPNASTTTSCSAPT